MRARATRQRCSQRQRRGGRRSAPCRVTGCRRAVLAGVLPIALLGGACASSGETPDLPIEALAGATIGIDDFYAVLAQRADEVNLPVGYDLHLEMIEPSIMTIDNVDFMLRFRASCNWVHWALRSARSEDTVVASEQLYALSSHPSFGEEDGPGRRLLRAAADSMVELDASVIENFLVANCVGIGLPE